MAHYAILIYHDEAQADRLSEAELHDVPAGHRSFQERAGEAVGPNEALDRTTTATSIRSDGNGGFMVTDGAFAETKEALCGVYFIEAGDLDEAIAMAKQVPAPNGGVEVRPIRRFA
jgi:hypothetical protein